MLSSHFPGLCYEHILLLLLLCLSKKHTAQQRIQSSVGKLKHERINSNSFIKYSVYKNSTVNLIIFKSFPNNSKTSLFCFNLKGSVQQKLSWVENGVIQQVWAWHRGAGSIRETKEQAKRGHLFTMLHLLVWKSPINSAVLTGKGNMFNTRWRRIKNSKECPAPQSQTNTQ